MHNPLTILSEPSMMHAAAVHLPIALSVFGVPVLFAALFFQNTRTLRILAFLIYATALVASMFAERTGEGARAILSNTLSPTIWELLDEHEQLAELVKFTSGLAALALALSMLNFKTWRECMLLVATCGAIATSVLAAGAAHLGGLLVYEHGVGTPMSHQQDQNMTKDAPPEAIELVPVLPIDPAAAKEVSYTRDVVPLIQTYCIDCHGSDDPDGAYDMSTHAGLLKAGEKAGPGVIPGDADGSALVQYISGALQPRMPKREPALSVDELHVFRSWIHAGATDDSGAIVTPESEPVDAAPAEAAKEVPAVTVDPFGSAALESAPQPDPAEEAPVETVDPFGAAAEPAPVAMEEAPALKVDPFGNAAAGQTPEADPAEEAPVEAVDPFGAAAEPAPVVMEEAPALKVDPFDGTATDETVEDVSAVVPEAQPDAAPVSPEEVTEGQAEEVPFDPFG